MNTSSQYIPDAERRLERYRHPLPGDARHVAETPPYPNQPVPDAGYSKSDSGDIPPSGEKDKIDFADLVGVRPADGGTARLTGADAKRDVPRLTFKPMHAVAVILILVAALCASLTMLVEQAVSYARQSPTQSAAVLGERAQGTDSDTPHQSKNSKSKGTGSSSSSGAEAQSTGGEEAQTQRATPQATAPPVDSGLVNINTADVTRLQSINGVGPVMAQRIIDYRSANGNFTSVDQLLSVSGIGAKTLEKMRPQVTV